MENKHLHWVSTVSCSSSSVARTVLLRWHVQPEKFWICPFRKKTLLVAWCRGPWSCSCGEFGLSCVFCVSTSRSAAGLAWGCPCRRGCNCSLSVALVWQHAANVWMLLLVDAEEHCWNQAPTSDPAVLASPFLLQCQFSAPSDDGGALGGEGDAASRSGPDSALEA